MKPGIFSIRKEKMNPDSYFTYRNQVTMDDCPHLKTPLKYAERKRIERKYGKNSALVLSMVYGRFRKSDVFERVFNENEIALARSSMEGHVTPLAGGEWAAMDPTGGGDSGVLMRRQGTRINLIEDEQRGDELELADYWITKLRDLHIPPERTWMDAMGIGGTVIKHMRRKGFNPNPFTANLNPAYSEIYRDRYTEILFMVKMMLQLQVLALPYCDNLLRDMKSRRYVLDANNKIKAEFKDRHRARENFSPDYLDTVVYLFMSFDQTIIENQQRMKEKKVYKESREDRMRKARMLNSGDMRAFGGMPNVDDSDAAFSFLLNMPDL